MSSVSTLPVRSSSDAKPPDWLTRRADLDHFARHVTSPHTLATGYNRAMHGFQAFPSITLSCTSLLWLWVINSAPLAGEISPDPTPVHFERDVRPLLRAHCMSCHGLEKRAGNLDLRTLPLLMHGGTQGPAIVPGSAARSLLYRKVTSRSMPPEGELPLTDAQLETLRRWLDSAEPPVPVEPASITPIDAGDRSHWAFQPLRRMPPPSSDHTAAARTMVDRFVHVFLNGAPWDSHANVKNEIATISAQTDLPTAGFLQDLAQRGLLEDTIVLWTGEFGRLPVSQNGLGRDHNRNAFTALLAGGGFRPGHIHGATDDVGYRATEDPVSVPDLFATILHQLGLDHDALTYHHHGRDETLTDSPVSNARVVEQLLA